MNAQPQTQTTYELAGFGTRLVAFIIDFIVLSLIGTLPFLFFDPMQMSLVELMVIDIAITTPYNWYFWTRHQGQTPGKRIMNIRVIKTDGGPLSDADALLRVFGYYVGRWTLFLGYVWAAFDSRNQAWHDKIANTVVVVVPPEKKTITI